mgnify:CR=1 FL=1
MKKNEEKSVRFKRLATRRVNNAVNMIRLIGNLSNTNNYTFNESDVNTIFNAIEEEFKLTKARFAFILKRRKRIQI